MAGINPAIILDRCNFPELWDYADGIDTMQFLLDL